jgi:HYDIN/CFA65/VesB-like, Ig-like domain/Abnormal spindle-like microcephaly-assoc'd, ASPM-SPD-2-Hydin
MPCSPLAVGVGLFINNPAATTWSAAPSRSVGGKTVTLAATGPAPGITVTGPNGTLFHPTVGTDISRYLFFGSNNYLLLLEAGTGVGPVQYTVSLIDFTAPAIREVTFPTVLADSSSVSFPVVQYSQGTGSAFLLLTTTGTEWTTVIYRSDNGVLLNTGPGLFIPTGPTQGEATATQTIIHYFVGGASAQFSQALPSGTLSIAPPTAVFPDAVIGGCPTSPPTVQLILRNTGNDCLIVNSIGNAAPFSVAATSQPLPAALPAGQQMSATIEFAPASTGVFGPTNLPIASTPAAGANKVICTGTGRNPVASITVGPNPIQFSNVSVGTSASPQTLTIQNNGEQPLNASVAPSPPGSPFSWAGYSGNITCGASVEISIGFTPSATGPAAAVLTVVNDAPAGPVPVQVLGTGGLSAATWTPANIVFGTIPEGSTAAQDLTITNNGDADLHVTNVQATETTNPQIDEFSVSPTSLTVPPGQSGYLTVTYTPQGSWPFGVISNGDLKFQTDDAAHPSVDVSLSAGASGCLGAPAALVARAFRAATHRRAANRPS